ncbi:homoserine kinase type II [Rhodoblastus acidophilus]|uniref:homoserine kinase n=1 Tax=Rhodoblastus acidophilus TaxID=1074 RepID=UPI0022255E15|nr:homoserine kinase [Rhodoblastus acidophilus]MCW2286110.1 homoserine kinase type II [Rhodoblastus acidophilus]MCW2335004.1 homoserine kinase type II [Rhodoblastus acidophilus]
MAVYTDVTDEALYAFLSDYTLGPALSFKGIAEGVENSNYLLHCQAGYFILTLYEKRVNPADLPFFLGLMEHLSARGLTCPVPVKRRDGGALGELAGRPAALVTFLDGVSTRKPDANHCLETGRALAQLHLDGEGFELHRDNALSLPHWRPLFETSREQADSVAPGLASEIARELDALEADWPRDLPKGVIHADLFPDNVFFIGKKLSGLIDFYFACDDSFAYDLAICLNAWCFEPGGAFNATKGRALLQGYESVRRLDAAERAALPILSRGAAMRFLLTRLYDWLNVPPGALVKPKNPLDYLTRLRFHQWIVSSSEYGLAS